MFSPNYYFHLYIIVICLQWMSIIGNGFIIIVFLTNSKLKSNKSLYLVPVLCITNTLFSLSALPFTIYLLILAKTSNMNFRSPQMVLANTPIMIDFKLNLIITIMIAIDRVQAIKYPMFYRNKNHKKFVIFTLIIGIGFGIIDTFIGIITIDYSLEVYKCPLVGCYQYFIFTAYWASSNMILEITLFILTFKMIYELSQLMKSKHSNQKIRNGTTSTTKITVITNFSNAAVSFKANRLSLGILITSFLFLFVPSILITFDEIFNVDIFKSFGPLYAIGLTIAGVLDSILYVSLHAEIRKAAFSLIFRKNVKNQNSDTNQITVIK